MDEQKVRAEIEKLVAKTPARQYEVGKKQITRLTELGIIDMMPTKFWGKIFIGSLDAKLVIEAAEDAGGYRVYGDEGFHEEPSALYQALHEAEPAAEDDAEDDEPVEVANYAFGDPDAENGELYIVYRRGSTYEVDAEWSDGPAAEFDHLPSEAEVEVVHRDYLEANLLQDELGYIEAEVAAIEQRRFEEREAAIEEQRVADETRRMELHPLLAFAHLAVPDTLRRAAIEGRLEAEKIGRDWLTDEVSVRRYLRSRYHLSKRAE